MNESPAGGSGGAAVPPREVRGELREAAELVHGGAGGGAAGDVVVTSAPTLRVRETLAYSCPSWALASTGIMVGTFVPRLYSDHLGLSLEVIGYVSLGALLLDAVSDPLAGYWSDATRSRWGRRRPFVACGGAGLAGAGLALLSPPAGLSERGLMGWAVSFILLVVLFSNLLRVPWLAWGMELTSGSYGGKTSVFAFREVVWVLGIVFGASLPLAASSIADEVARFRAIGAVVAAVCLLSCAGCVYFVREPRQAALPARARRLSLLAVAAEICTRYAALWRAMFGGPERRAASALLAASTLYSAGAYLNSFFFAYYVSYVVEASSDELVFVLLTYILCGVVTIPLWLRLSHRVEKHHLTAMSMTLQSAVLLAAFAAVGRGDLAPYLALVACAGSSFGAFSVFKSSMIGDLADADAWRSPTGERREGEIQGLFDLSSRSLSACLVGPALIVLNDSYVPNRHPQTAQAETAIRVAYGLVPALMGSAAVLCMLRYDLTRERHERLRLLARAVPEQAVLLSSARDRDGRVEAEEARHVQRLNDSAPGLTQSPQHDKRDVTTTTLL